MSRKQEIINEAFIEAALLCHDAIALAEEALRLQGELAFTIIRRDHARATATAAVDFANAMKEMGGDL